MDEFLDFYLLVSLLTTVLAVILASLFMKLRSSGEKEQAGESREKPEVAAAGEDQDQADRGEGGNEKEVQVPLETVMKEESGIQGGEEESKEKTERIPEEIWRAEQRQQRAREEEAVKTVPAEKQSPQRITISSKTAEEEGVDYEESKEETHELEVTKAMDTDLADEGEEELFSLKYSPGKLRGSHYEKMMTKEEHEEEQRVQSEQLANIIQLMKEKQETFGEMTEADMEEQLKLYNM
ncbi:matrix-remodeling-associated protein 7 isoform X2 [Microcaecilia unicolor]|uniref:Matrix-remodeling-associated protein 7 isoform X2 n=1 Tax=Microcaecilia unicolor TaxID=1415580 RepID=A0A6P7YG80_9AMPH|nr:matrix-remodeling-associated protein 7 isoform X2 [Microcaecilia unicolor]